jgi:SAM-dependent methyltransferase
MVDTCKSVNNKASSLDEAMTEITELEIRKSVRDRYTRLATGEESSCCGIDESCCGPSQQVSVRGTVPPEAASVNAGCSSPLLLASPKEGDIVLDLGSGGGIDVFRSSELVGTSGRVIGVDSTPEMIWRARETASEYGNKYKNVEFRLGEIEHLPIESNLVDYVISNCVINLSPDKRAVFRESFRVLKPGAKFAVVDITLDREIPESARTDMDSWSACVSGALSDSEYARLLSEVGFIDVKIDNVSNSTDGKSSHPFNYYSSHITAIKPVHWSLP